MITIDSIAADNHESALDTGINDLENDTGAHTNLYSGQVEGAFGLFCNSFDIVNINAIISGSNCNHIYCVKDELLSNCDTKESVDDETDSNCDTCLVENESVRPSDKDSVCLHFVNHDYMCQPLCLEKDFCDIDSVQDSTFEDMMSCSNSNKSSEFHMIWPILSDNVMLWRTCPYA